MTDLDIATIALLCAPAIILLLLGFAIGRISTAPAPKKRFPLSDRQLALIAYEASRAYRHSRGCFRAKSFNNLDPIIRKSMIARMTAFRDAPWLPSNAGVEQHIQAAIVDLAS